LDFFRPDVEIDGGRIGFLEPERPFPATNVENGFPLGDFLHLPAADIEDGLSLGNLHFFSSTFAASLHSGQAWASMHQAPVIPQRTVDTPRRRDD
jgi:hypothetical protein